MAVCYLVLIFIIITISLVLTKLYIKLTTRWCRSKTCLLGKTAIITGANTGIGYQTALDFAMRGGRVILACRNEYKAEQARRKIAEVTGNDNVIVKLIDMNSFASVRAFAKDIKETEDRLDILVNNAGIAEMGNVRTKDGQILILQVNYFSSFLLTNLLMSLLKKTEGSRIINVASVLAKLARNFDVNKICNYPGMHLGYSYSKLCNILFTIELAKKLKGSQVTTYSVHPGTTQTDIFDYVRGPLVLFVKVFKNTFFKTVEEGAQTPIYCSVTKGIEHYSGEHFDRCRRVERYSVASDPELPKRLWKVSEETVKLTPEEVHFT